MHYSSGVHYGATGSSRPASQTAHSVSAVVSQWQLSKRFCERDVFRSNVPLIQISVGSGLERVPLSDSLPSAGVSLRGG